MRTFIALELGKEPRRALAELLEKLSAELPGVRWSKPGNVHLTLRFLGEINDALIPEVAEAAREAAARCPPLFLKLGRPGAFGGRSPRVLFLRVEGDLEELARVYSELENELEKRGFGREERSFKPHLTLGRRKKGSVPPSWTELVSLKEITDWEAEEIVLFSSTLTPSGPIYTPLGRFPLRGEEIDSPGRQKNHESS